MGRIKGQAKQEVFDLGEYTPGTEQHMALMEARNIAEHYKAELRQGINPRERIQRQVVAKEEEARIAKARQELTFSKVREDYFEHPAFLTLKPNSRLGYRSALTAAEFDILSDQIIDEISRADVIAVIEAIEARGKLVMAKRTLAYLKAFFNWCWDRNLLPDNSVLPTYRVKASLKKEKPRDRTLSLHEVAIFWEACEYLGYPFGSCFQLMLATVQRRSECTGIDRWSIDWEGAVWTMKDNKANREHLVPLNAMAMYLLSMADKATGSRLLFSTTGITAVSGVSKAKRRLDERIQILKERLPESEREGVFDEPWQLHDLRRTATRNLRELGFSQEVCSRILNHAKRGVTALHYDTYDMLPEKTQALAAWNERLCVVVMPKSRVVAVSANDNVVPLRRVK